MMHDNYDDASDEEYADGDGDDDENYDDGDNHYDDDDSNDNNDDDEEDGDDDDNDKRPCHRILYADNDYYHIGLPIKNVK